MVEQPNLIEIDLSLTTSQGGGGLEVGRTYLVLYGGRFHTGSFSMQWYGLNFEGIFSAGAQYDPPGVNYSSWQRIWQFTNAARISEETEHDYAASKRAHAIRSKMTSNGQTIDETAPLEAFTYYPTRSAMPKMADEDDYDLEA
jgi:hypothetical protein